MLSVLLLPARVWRVRVAYDGWWLQVPLEELDLRRLREAAEEMREQLSLTSKVVSSTTARQHSSPPSLFLLTVCLLLVCIWIGLRLYLHSRCSGCVLLQRCVVASPARACPSRCCATAAAAAG
jgi:hypothetical protein